MVMSKSDVSKWTSVDVSRWLGSLSLQHLVPNFERLQIDGPKLIKLSDQDLLRLTKPAEVMAIRGAIDKLVEDVARPPQNPRARSGSFDKKSSQTVPRDLQRNNVATEQLRQPKLVQGSAPELLDKECKYSGWIRKQGGGYKNWKRRYLILRLGCLYYFQNETSATAKGSFVVSGYTTEMYSEKKYKYTLKLTPADPHVRTYYLSVGSERELMGWKEAIDSEIRMVSSRVSLGKRQTSEPNILNEHNHEREEDEPNYDFPPDNEMQDSSSEDEYSKSDDNGFPIPTIPEGKPVVPTRSAYSLQSPTSNIPPAMLSRTEARESPESTYLPIIGIGGAKNPVAARPDLFRRPPSPVLPPATLNNVGHDDNDYDNAPDEEGGEEDDPYYILFKKPDELMPPCCVFGRLERSEADRLLKVMGKDGTYLIRGGSRAGAEKVLSVWHIDRCRHYKLFKDTIHSTYSLTQGLSFRTIPELLQYYTLQAHLPKSDFYLGNPYNPDTS